MLDLELDKTCYDSIEDLALNLRSSWNHSTDPIWRQLDPELWDLTHNPWAVLQTVSKKKLATLLADEKFNQLVNQLIQTRNNALNAPSWFQKTHPNTNLTTIAYFSMEYMLSEALPIYSGGLGNVAGDQLKAASDLGVPVIAIGLLYSQGYFRQLIDISGQQQELYPFNDPGLLPIKPLRNEDGEWLRLKVDLPGWPLWIRTWEAKVGRRNLYLLDTNDIANLPIHRGITSQLYGGDKELRLKQELVLGIGGWRLLEALGLKPEICHMNEGHAAFVVLERASSYMKEAKVPFETALVATKTGNLFTTHTAVSAGFDKFHPDLIAKFLGKYAQANLKISIEKLLALGQINPSDEFNMAFLAIRGSGFVNAVSKLHGNVSRDLFKALFPRYPENEIPVDYVTNGVHMASWDSSVSDELWTESCGKERWLGKTEDLEKKIRTMPDSKIWEMRKQSRKQLIDFARTRLTKLFEVRGYSESEVQLARTILDPEALTLGFARRFASYKRPDLLLKDENRLLRILTNNEKPVQLIIAGKAHPADGVGHSLIKKWMDFIRNTDARFKVIFLSDDDMLLTEHLVQGVDLWINTPRRPWEACGTSGMKVLVNGGLNLSELDGWWAEAYTPEVGWALGDRQEHGDDPNWDMTEANTLYDLLEKEVVPLFYDRDSKNIPIKWINKIRESMAQLTPRYSSNRTVREYTEKFYLPASELYRKRTNNNSSIAKQIVEWKSALEKEWPKLKFGEVKIKNVGERQKFEVLVYLGELKNEFVKVEIYSNGLIKEMDYQGTDSKKWSTFSTEVSTELPAKDFTPRIIPQFDGIALPLEAPQILWQK